MSSLSRKKRNGKTCFEIWVGNEPDRSSVWLGNLSKSAANEILGHVIQLEAAKVSNTRLPNATTEWVRGLEERFHQKLVKARLVKERSSATVGGFFSERLAKLECSPRTRNIYELAHAKFFASVDPTSNLRDVTPEMAHDFYHVELAGAGMADSYRAKTAKIIREFFAKAVKFELIDRNPFAGFEITSEVNLDRHVFIDRLVIGQIIDAASDVRWRCLLGFSGLCGLRTRSEVAAICWEHIHWDANTFTVPSVKTKERTVPIFGDFREYLEAYHRQVIGPDMLTVATGPIFLDCPKQPALTRRLNRTVAEAGVQSWVKPWMNLRSSVETELVRQGFDLTTVTKWLGNSPDVARKHYLQITPDDIAKASAMGAEKKSADSPQSSEVWGSKNEETPSFASAEKRGKAEKHTREDSNLQPSVPKTDALSN